MPRDSLDIGRRADHRTRRNIGDFLYRPGRLIDLRRRVTRLFSSGDAMCKESGQADKSTSPLPRNLHVSETCRKCKRES